MMKDAENNAIIVYINSTENIPCGCLEVYEDEETNTIIFKVNKILLKSEDEGFHEIGISLMDESQAYTNYTFTIVFNYYEIYLEEIED